MQAAVVASEPLDETSVAFAKAHAELVREGGFQFDRAGYRVPETPEWLHWVSDLLSTIGPGLKWAFWIGVAILVALILYAVAREISRLRAPPARAKPMDLPAEGWRPDADDARNLLAEADALAAKALFAEAVHLILLRSVADIRSRRPRAVRPAFTTREISSLPDLPPSARSAFQKIGALVEASLFGGAQVSPAEFADCRAAYEDFALPDGWSR